MPRHGNYLCGILNHAHTTYATWAKCRRAVCRRCRLANGDALLDIENPPSEGAELLCSVAIEVTADVHHATMERGRQGVRPRHGGLRVGLCRPGTFCAGNARRQADQQVTVLCSKRQTSVLTSLTHWHSKDPSYRDAGRKPAPGTNEGFSPF